jgi:hypothetical protein
MTTKARSKLRCPERVRESSNQRAAVEVAVPTSSTRLTRSRGWLSKLAYHAPGSPPPCQARSLISRRTCRVSRPCDRLAAKMIQSELRTGGVDDEAPLPNVDAVNLAELEREHEEAEEDEEANAEVRRLGTCAP